jgi:hypothetical protein
MACFLMHTSSLFSKRHRGNMLQEDHLPESPLLDMLWYLGSVALTLLRHGELSFQCGASAGCSYLAFPMLLVLVPSVPAP